MAIELLKLLDGPRSTVGYTSSGEAWTLCFVGLDHVCAGPDACNAPVRDASGRPLYCPGHTAHCHECHKPARYAWRNANNWTVCVECVVIRHP